MVKTQILKHLPGQEKAIEEGAKEMSIEERWRRVGMSGLLREEEVRRDDPVEYFLPTGVGSTS